MSMNATKAKTSVPPARPSSPSVMFTPFAAAMIAKAANSDVQPTDRSDTTPTNGTAMPVDRVGLLDLVGDEHADDD